MNRTARIATALALGALALTGCSYRTIDPVVTGADLVPGTGSLYRMCDQAVLIYVSILPNEYDNPEMFLPGWCEYGADGVWRPAIGAPVPGETTPPPAVIPDPEGD